MKVLHGLCAVILLLATPLSQGSSQDPGKVIAGWIEKISLVEPPLIIKAKLDTGAKTSSIHAINVEQFKQDGDRWVRFDLVLTDVNDKQHTLHMEKPKARRVRIKNTDGDHDRRAVVELEFCFDGRKHVTEFTLADRSEYIYDVLLGRKFLQGIAVVDPEATFLTQAGCPQ
ncbi:MAG: ATP-dependent zinc protease [Pseudomonadota bacterium]